MNELHGIRLIVNYPILHILQWLKQHIVVSNAVIIIQTKQQWASEFFINHYQEPRKDLTSHLQMCQMALLELCKLAKVKNFQLKMLPFPIAGTFFSTNQELVSIPVFDPNHQAYQFSISHDDISWHYYNEYLSSLERLSEPVKISENGIVILPELLGICTKNGEQTTSLARKWVERENKLDNSVRQNLAHRHIYCLVVSKKGRLLLHQRVGGKDNELLWDKSNGGHVNYGEASIETCLRELEEELSIQFKPNEHKLQVLETIRQPEDHLRFVPNKNAQLFEFGMYDLFLLSGIDEEDVKLDKTEVIAIQWFEIANAIQFIENESELVTPDLIRLLPIIKQLYLLQAM